MFRNSRNLTQGIVQAGMAERIKIVPRRLSRWFVREGKPTTEIGGVSVLGGRIHL